MANVLHCLMSIAIVDYLLSNLTECRRPFLPLFFMLFLCLYFLLLVSSLLWSGCFLFALLPCPATCFFCVCGVYVVRWQPAAATHSSPLWPRSQGRRVPTVRSPLPLPAAPPPQGLTLMLLLTRYSKSSSVTWSRVPLSVLLLHIKTV